MGILIESLWVAQKPEEYLNRRWRKTIPSCSCWRCEVSRRRKEASRDSQRKPTSTSESLYKMLSQRGNPELKSLDALLHAMGFGSP